MAAPKYIDWSAVPDLGRTPDTIIGARLGCCSQAVRNARVVRGIPAAKTSRLVVLPPDLLATLTEVGEDVGVTVEDLVLGTVRDAFRVLICGIVGLDPVWLHDDRVRMADLRILLDERAALLTEPPPRAWDIEAMVPLGVRIVCASPVEAAASWSYTLRQLLRERDGGAE